MSVQDALNIKNARALVSIQISGLGEVSVGLVYGREVPRSGPSISDAVQQWLEAEGLLSEWREETAKYIRALSRVDLPVAADTYYQGKVLAYHLKMSKAGTGMTINVYVRVCEDRARAELYMRAGYDECDRIKLGDCIMIGPITTDTLKAEVSKSLDKLWDLMQQPMVAD